MENLLNLANELLKDDSYKNIEINRKMLSEMAISDAEGFAKLVDVAKASI